MTVPSIRLATSIPLSNLIRATNGGGSLTLPLAQPNSFIRLKHVLGLPSGSDGYGYSVSKLQMLDTLIERLQALRGKSYKPPVEDTGSPERLAALFAQLTEEVHADVQRLSQTPYGIAVGAGGAPNGMMLNLSA